MLDRKVSFPVPFCFTLEFLLPTNYPRESATSFCSPHLPTWVGSTHGLWVGGFKKDTSIGDRDFNEVGLEAFRHVYYEIYACNTSVTSYTSLQHFS